MFKEAFKYYKSKQPPPDLSTVLRISENSKEVEVMNYEICECGTENVNNLYGLKPLDEWNVFQIKNKPGLIFIKNPFTGYGQRYWISRCLKDFSKKPNKLNIDVHNYLNQDENWWDVCTSKANEKNNLSTKLRWATLGYHHNWDTKVYSESSKDEFPEDLGNLCKIIGNVLGFKDFKAEAAIVNYYYMNSTLSGHTDHSEVNLDAPLFSFSFGQSAIFLIGGLTEDDPALPLFIDSGDVLIMSKESRLCYHAVPKILPAFHQPWDEIEEENSNLICDWSKLNEFIKSCRLNLNVRQVLRFGQTSLND